jgi:hypothetical protein
MNFVTCNYFIIYNNVMLARVTRVLEEHSASIFTAVRSVVPCITLNALKKKWLMPPFYIIIEA